MSTFAAAPREAFGVQEAYLTAHVFEQKVVDVAVLLTLAEPFVIAARNVVSLFSGHLTKKRETWSARIDR